MVSTEKGSHPGGEALPDDAFRVDLENSQSLDQKAEVPQDDYIQSVDEAVPDIKTFKIERTLREIELWLGRNANIETQGVERIKEEEKQPPPIRNAFLMWWSMLCNPGGLPVGILGTQWGLSLSENVIACIIGTLLGAVLVAYCGILGAKLGLRSMASCRYSFGYRGAKLVSILNIVLGVGYSVVSTSVCGQLLPAAANYSISTNVGICIVSTLALVISFFGFSTIHKFESYSWLLAFVLFCVLLGQTVPLMKVDMLYVNPRREGFAASFLSYLSFSIAGSSGWSTAIADYYCHYPKTTPSWKLNALTIAGFITSSTFVAIVGACIGLVAIDTSGPYPDIYNTHGLGGLIREISHPLAWSKFMLVMLIFTVLGGIIANYYSCGLSFQILGQHFRYIPRFVWSFLVAILVTALSVIGKDHLLELVGNLGNMLGYLTAAYAVILFIEDKWFRRHDGYDVTAWNDKDRLPWGLAAVASLIVSYLAGAVPGMNTTWFIGPIAAMFGDPAGDVGLILNLAFTIITYFAFRTIEKRLVGR
ncbi:hypothetical protein FQN49_001808 [Arthroderma sp. PD_2]|nr:hypothetical protein FQN49_001808 [Arthroderma sp. PD_2]